MLSSFHCLRALSKLLFLLSFWVDLSLGVAQSSIGGVEPSSNNCHPHSQSFLASGQSTSLELHCLQCIPQANHKKNLICTRCRDAITTTDGRCVPKKPFPIENCIEFYEYNGLCVACKKGFYLSQNKCHRSDFEKNCEVSDLRGGKQRCFSCDGGETVPALDFSGCISDSGKIGEINSKLGGDGCQTFSLDVTNPDQPKVQCSLCKFPFILKEDPEKGLKCIKPMLYEALLNKTECSKGCAFCRSDNTCLYCNYKENFYMVDQHRCVKLASIFRTGFLIILALVLLCPG